MATEHVPAVSDIDYTPANVTSHPAQRARLYLPSGAPEDYGYMDGRWPIIVVANFDGFTTSTPQLSYSQDDPYLSIETPGVPLNGVAKFLDAGRAVFDVTFSRANFSYGATPPLRGFGLQHYPGADSGRWEDRNYPMAFKDAVYVVAYLKANADDIDGSGTKIRREVGWYGRSAGAVIGLWPAYRPTLMLGMGSVTQDSMYGQTTELAFLSGSHCSALSIKAFDLGMGGAQFPDSAQHPNYGTASSINESPAATQGDVHDSYRENWSVLFVGDEEYKKSTPFVMGFGSGATGSSAPVNFTFSSATLYENQETFIHSAWGGLLWASLYEKARVFICQDDATMNSAATLFERGFDTVRNMTDNVIQIVLQLTEPERTETGDRVRPVTSFAAEGAVFHSGSLAGGATALLIPANENRKQGIYYFNTSLTAGSYMTLNSASPASAFNGLTVNDPSGATTTGTPSSVFIAGTAALYGRARSGFPNTWSAQEI